MKILYLCHRIPYPPNKGEKIRAFHQLRALAEKHEVDLFTLADDPDDLKHRAALEKYCRSVYVARIHRKLARIRILPYLLSRSPLTVGYFRSSELASELRRQVVRQRYDRVFLYCSAMGQYLENIPGDIPVIADLVDVDSNKWAQYAKFARFPLAAAYHREAYCLRKYEREVSENAACVLVSTEREARLLRAIAPAAAVEAVPNGVDTEYFSPTAISPRGAPPTVVFTGDMSYFPNEQAVIWFAREVLPAIRREIAQARLLIVGRNPGPAVRGLERTDGAEVTGYVPDVRTHLARAKVAVAPFRIAAGIQNKILEAMAFGLPVVATPRATQGLTSGAAELVQTAEGAAEFAAKTIELLRDSEAAHKLGMESRRCVAREYSWEGALRRTLDLVENPAGTGSFAGRAAVPGTAVGS